jgi:hypothetical protein
MRPLPEADAFREWLRGKTEGNLISPLLRPEEASEYFSRPVSWLGAFDLPAFPFLSEQ